jgi:hypothetical protein
MVFMEPTGRLYSALKGESDLPALVLNRDKGGAVVYLPSLAGDFYARLHMREYQALLASSVRWTRGGSPLLEAHCPPTVQIELRRRTDPDRMLVHLVNNTGDMQRPISEIIPIRDIRVRLAATGHVRRVHTLSTCQDLPFQVRDGYIEFELPMLELYEVVVIQ